MADTTNTTNTTKKYLSLEGLQEYDALIKQEIADAVSEFDGKADANHNHNDLYYTETEIDAKINEVNASITKITDGTTPVKKAESANTAESATTAESANTAVSATKATQDGSDNVITETYETKVDAAAKLDDAKEYTNEKVSGLATTSSVTSSVNTAISTHNTSEYAHSDIREALAEVKEDVDVFFKDADLTATAKDTLKEIQEYITSDASAASEMLASINNKADKTHTHAVSEITGLQDVLEERDNEINEAINQAMTDASNQDAVVLAEAQNSAKAYTDSVKDTLTGLINGKADSTHSHAISDVTNLQAALDGKASSDHTHTVDATLLENSENPVQNKAVYSVVSDLTEAVSNNTKAISSHTAALAAIGTITSEDIQALFAPAT